MMISKANKQTLVPAGGTFPGVLLECMDEAVFAVDCDGNICLANTAAVSISGYTVEELNGAKISSIVPFLADDLRSTMAGCTNSAVPQTSVTDSSTSLAEGLLRKKTSETIEVLLRLSRFLHEGEDLLLVLVRDISELKGAKHECEELRRQVIRAQRLESIGTLTGGIAHDFNNLLGGILGYASFSKTFVDKNSRVFRAISAIETTAIRAAALTRQLLGMIRGDTYEVRPTDLNKVVMEVVRLLSRTINKNISIETFLEDNLPVVKADDGQIQQVLLNICINARDAMPDGGRLIISTKSFEMDDEFCRMNEGAKSGKYVYIVVADTGIGMDDLTRSKIFEPFFTTKDKNFGTGLGLSMVWSIVKNHKGYIKVETKPGEGSTFHIYLPVTDLRAGYKDLPGKDRPIQSGSETILVVDDEEVIREMTRQALEGYGYKVLTCSSGQSAIDIFKNRHDEIDLVIIDRIMPDMSGKETFIELEKISPDVKALLITGYGAESEVREELGLGIRGFMQKPFQIADLCEEIRLIIEEKD